MHYSLQTSTYLANVNGKAHNLNIRSTAIIALKSIHLGPSYWRGLRSLVTFLCRTSSFVVRSLRPIPTYGGYGGKPETNVWRPCVSTSFSFWQSHRSPFLTLSTNFVRKEFSTESLYKASIYIFSVSTLIRRMQEDAAPTRLISSQLGLVTWTHPSLCSVHLLAIVREEHWTVRKPWVSASSPLQSQALTWIWSWIWLLDPQDQGPSFLHTTSHRVHLNTLEQCFNLKDYTDALESAHLLNA